MKLVFFKYAINNMVMLTIVLISASANTYVADILLLSLKISMDIYKEKIDSFIYYPILMSTTYELYGNTCAKAAYFYREG